MSKILKLNALAASVVVGALGAGVAQAATANPFAASDLPGGYRQLAGAEGSCGNHGSEKPKGEEKGGSDADKAYREGKCGEGKCGEGKCGAEMMKDDLKADEAKKEAPKK